MLRSEAMIVKVDLFVCKVEKIEKVTKKKSASKATTKKTSNKATSKAKTEQASKKTEGKTQTTSSSVKTNTTNTKDANKSSTKRTLKNFDEAQKGKHKLQIKEEVDEVEQKIKHYNAFQQLSQFNYSKEVIDVTEKLYIYRIIVSVLVILTGLSGTIATFGISAFITYNNNYSGNLWSDMSYTGMTFFFVLSIIIYLLGWVLLLVYAKPKELNGKENEK